MVLPKSKLAILHIAKKQLGLDDQTYRDALEAYGGVRSSAGLDYKGFVAVVKHFEKCGFQSDFSKRKATAQKTPQTKRPGSASDKQIRMIYALWFGMPSYYEKGKEYAALRGFLQKRFRMAHENFLTFQKAHAVIEALKKIGQRQ